jgi:hypothetical protein
LNGSATAGLTGQAARQASMTGVSAAVPVNLGRAAAPIASSATMPSCTYSTPAKACELPRGSQGQIERAEGGHAEGEAALLQGDQHSAADAAEVPGYVGQHATEQSGEQHRLSGADQGERRGHGPQADVRPVPHEHRHEQGQSGHLEDGAAGQRGPAETADQPDRKGGV